MRRVLIVYAIVTVHVAVASAQERKWEVEGYGGVIAGQAVSAGSLTLPAPGAPIVTSNPTFPSRETPSWFFGHAVRAAAIKQLAGVDPWTVEELDRKTAEATGMVLSSVWQGVLVALLFVFVFTGFRAVLKNRWAAVAVIMVVLGMQDVFGSSNPPVTLAFTLPSAFLLAVRGTSTLV